MLRIWFAALLSVGVMVNPLITALASHPPSDEASGQVSQWHTAHWYDSDRVGEGWSLEVLDSGQALAYWFTYDEAGHPRWLYGIGDIDGDRIEFADLLVTAGGRFGPGFDPEEVVFELAGTAVMQFDDCDSGWANITAFDQEFVVSLERLSRTLQLDCDPPPDSTDQWPAHQSGSWYDPAHDGEGFTLQWLVDGTVLLTWFSYDPDGNQYWMQGIGEPDGDELHFPDVYTASGPAFGVDFSAEELELMPWGTLSMGLNCDEGWAEYESVLPQFGQGSFELQRLSLPVGLECPPTDPGGADFDALEWETISFGQPALSEKPAATLGDYIYVGGGMTSLTESVRQFWRFHPETEQWTRLADLPNRRDHAMMAAFDGRIYYFGGYRNTLSGPSNNAWVYNPDSNNWSTLSNMPGNRAAGGAAALGEHIYVAGGWGTAQSMFRFTPATNTWQSFPVDDSWDRDHSTVIAYQGEIWIMGGRGFPAGANNGVTIFDPSTNSSRPGPNMVRHRGGFSAAVVGDYILAAGGELLQQAHTIASAEIYVPGEGWRLIASLPVAVHGAGGASHGGDFYVMLGSVVGNDIIVTPVVQRLRLNLD
jgi:hypothetical protein